MWPLLAAGFSVLSFALGLAYARYLRGKPRRTMAVITHDLQQRCSRYVEAQLYVAECEADVAHLLADMPREHVRPVLEAMRIGWRAQRMALDLARQRGLLPAGDLASYPGEPDEAPPKSAEEPRRASAMPERQEGFEMRGGRYLPRGSA